MNNRSLKAVHLVLLGACAVSAQALFARELLALFSGTEFVIGLILAAWLFWIGMGGIVGGRLWWLGGKADFKKFFVISILVAFLLPLTILAIRTARVILVNPPGSLPSMGGALFVSVTITAPFCFLYGVLYNIASKLWKGVDGTIASSASRVYIYESVGSVFGAILFSFVLIALMTQFLVALVISLLVVSALLFVPSSRHSFVKRLVLFSAVSVMLVFFSRGVDRFTMGRIFRGYKIEDVQFSRYGEIVLASHHDELTVFLQGSRLLSVPEPERVEEIVHIPMLLHPKPQDILLIGGSLGGAVDEILKYNSVREVDCLELDRKLLKLRQRIENWTSRDTIFFHKGTTSAESEAKVRYIHCDGRFFLRKAKKRYDLIIISAPPPLNLQINRYYTVQFFKEAKRSLKKGGLLAFIHPSSENFITFEQATILKSLKMTLAVVFKHVVVLPGTSAHFVAGDGKIDTNVILKRLKRRGIETRFINANYLPFRFSKERISYLKSVLSGAVTARVNDDNRPFASFLELLLKGKKMQFKSLEILRKFIYVRPQIPFAISSAFLLVLILISKKRGSARVGVWIVGFTSFMLEILVLLQFQSFSGLLYHAFILLTAVFMAGAAIGAFFLLNLDGSRKRQLLFIHAAFVVAIALFLILSRVINAGNIPYAIGISIFMMVSFLAGFLTGSYYPVILQLALKDREGMVPSEYYAWDLFGACVGGATGGVLFFPIMGVGWTGLSLIIAHFVAMLILPRRI